MWVRRGACAWAERILGAVLGVMHASGDGLSDGRGLVQTCVCGSGGCDMTAIMDSWDEV